MVLMMWLIAGANPFCSEQYMMLRGDPCNGHGQCFSAGLCHCDVGYGPESKRSEVDMCSCDGFCGARTHIVGAEGRLYLIEKTLPKGARTDKLIKHQCFKLQTLTLLLSIHLDLKPRVTAKYLQIVCAHLKMINRTSSL